MTLRKHVLEYTTASDLALRLSRLLAGAGMTPEDAAREAGLNKTTIYKMLQGKGPVTYAEWFFRVVEAAGGEVKISGPKGSSGV